MVRVYTDRWNGFQFRAPVYVDRHFNPYRFDLVKWESCEPHEAINMSTGKKDIVTEYCFTVASLDWNKKELGFKFSSCGLRYLEHYIDGLNEFVLDFCKMMEKELAGDDDECEDDC